MSDIRQTRTYRFHGLRLRVQCSPVLAHWLDSRFRLLPVGGDEPKATITFDFRSVLDSSRHVVAKPIEKSRGFYELPSGEARYFIATDQLYLSFGNGVRALGNPSSGGALFSVIESEPLNLFVASHLVLTIMLVEMLKRRGYYSLHAAGFTSDGKAVLIPGASGAGKSTLAVTLLRSGFGYLSDDMVFLRNGSGGLQLFGFPEDIDVSDETVAFFPELHFLKHACETSGPMKQQVRVDEVYRTELVRQSRPGVIVFPQISESSVSAVRRIDTDEAFVELVSNVLLTEATACQNHLNILTELVQHTPCYRLDTGRDFDRIPALLRELLSNSREEIHV